MKKKVLLLTVLPLILLLSGCGNTKDTVSVYCLTKLQEFSGNSCFEQNITYDTKGNIVQIQWSKDGVAGSSETFTYDTQGNCIEKVQYNSEGQAHRRVIYNYAENGSIQSAKIYDIAKENNLLYDCIYDQRGSLLKETHYGADGTPSSWEVYTYDSKGNKLQRDSYREGELCYCYQWTYDKNDNAVTRDHYEYGQLTFHEERTYDDHGNVLSIANPNSDTLYFTYTYDSMGRLLAEKMVNEAGEEVTVFEYVYDENGHMTEKRRNEGSSQFAYDNHGNLVASESFLSGIERTGHETYTYVSFEVTPEEAQRIRAQQAEKFFFPNAPR